MNRIIKRLAVPLSAAAVLGTAGFAYMASNSVDPSYAGTGTSTISGFNVTNISYYSDGTNFTYVNFDVDPQGPHTSSSDPANAQISEDGTNWFSCTRTALVRANTPEAHFVCDLRGDNQPVTASGLQVTVTH